MSSHRLHQVVLETEATDLVGAVMRPKAWPAFRYQGIELRKALKRINGWSLNGVSDRLNKCAGKVAFSVTKEKRYQSYVAQGAPSWLRDLLEADRQGR